MKRFSYKNAGVDIEKGDPLVQAIKPMVESAFRPEVLTKIGGFAGCLSRYLERYKKPILVSSTDGECKMDPEKRVEEIGEVRGPHYFSFHKR